MFYPTEHAIWRYIERFEGNLSFTAAKNRLHRIVKQARFRRTLPGGARLYSTGSINLVVCNGCIVTVQRLTYTDAPIAA